MNKDETDSLIIILSDLLANQSTLAEAVEALQELIDDAYVVGFEDGVEMRDK